MDKKIIVAASGLLLVALVPIATTLIALAIVTTVWNLPPPSIGIVLATCCLLGPAWFAVTWALQRKVLDGTLNAIVECRSGALRGPR